MTKSVFARFERKAWPYRFNGTLLMTNIAGGTPSDPKTAEAWLRTKLADKDDLIRAAVVEVMEERGIGADEAAVVVTKLNHLNGFRHDEKGLYMEGRHLKACLKEAASVAVNAGQLPAKGWGTPTDPSYKKGVKGWFPEHVCIVEDRIYLGVSKPTGVMQRFVHSRHGAGIQYEEYVEDCKIDFTVTTDYDFKPQEWALIWLKAEEQGLGASRSQGFGRFKVIRWDKQ